LAETRWMRAVSDAHGVLVLGQTNRYVLNIVRSLGRAGYPVVLGRGAVSSVTEKSRFTCEIWCHPSSYRGSVLKDSLRDFLKARPDIEYVFPSGDPETAYLAEFHRELSEQAVLVMPSPMAVGICLDKERCLELATEVGVPVAPYREVADLASLRDAVAAIGFPCVVKPCRFRKQVAGRKALIIEDEATLAEHLPTWPREHHALIVQRYISGPRRNIAFAARKGVLLAAQQDVAVRTSVIDGTGFSCLAVTTPANPQLVAYTESLTRALDYNGIGLIQFIIDAKTGRTTLLEINPRYGGSAMPPGDTRMDFPRLAVELAACRLGEADGVTVDYPAGRRVSSIHLDLKSLVGAYRRGEIGPAGSVTWLLRALSSFAFAHEDTIWSWRDPAPGLYGFVMPFRRQGRS
jgi:D-aspartate ligase